MANQFTGKDFDGNPVTLDTRGTKIDGQTLETGGYSTLGWLSSIRKAITDRLPAALVNGALSIWVQNAGRAANTSSLDGEVATLMTDTTAVNVIAGQGAGQRLHITELTVTNAHATVGTWVEIRSATTVRRHIYAGPEGGGGTFTFPQPIRLGDNEALAARCLTTGASVRVSASGYAAA